MQTFIIVSAAVAGFLATLIIATITLFRDNGDHASGNHQWLRDAAAVSGRMDEYPGDQPDFGGDNEEYDEEYDEDDVDDEEMEEDEEEEYAGMQVEYAGDETEVFYGYASNVQLYQDVAKWDALINSGKLASTPWLEKVA